ncbi:uncharacterized protein LOC135494599 [Lineus longissimus]|uniref:uncharacterized protein LOC135494599 n=1 Tax=Lineus longissimus TaxID=88925 RepID=UPI00315CCFD0
MPSDHFQFSFHDPIDLECTITVIVYKAVSRLTPIAGLRPGTARPNADRVRELVKMLTTDDLLVNPNPTRTLQTLDRPNIRLDTQPATNVYRNLHVQQGTSSFAVLAIEHGAEVCHFFNYSRKLLGYAQDGLMASFRDSTIWNIRVRFERRRKQNHNEKKPVPVPRPPVVLTRTGIDEVLEKGMPKFQEIAKRLREGIMASGKFAKNSSMITRGTELILHIEQDIEKGVKKAVEKEGAHSLERKIPIVSTLFGLVFGAMRLREGDFAGAFMEVASGVAADIPGYGTAASLVIDAALLGKDIANTIADEKNKKRLAESDIAEIKEENKQIRETLAGLLPRSELYGLGTEGYFDESDLAVVDDIIKIHVNCGELIDGIQVEYRHGGLGNHHGGHGGERRTVHLKNGEHVTTVKGSLFIDFKKRSIISSLTFITDYDNEYTFGSPKGRPFEFEMLDGTHLGAIQGCDFFSGRKKAVPDWEQYIELLPAIRFVSTYSAIDFA